jgi:hypothetical protein
LVSLSINGISDGKKVSKDASDERAFFKLVATKITSALQQ